MSEARLKHSVEFAVYRLLRGLVRLLPERASSALGSVFGWCAGSLVRVRRANVDEHLALAFPSEVSSWRARVARASYRHVGREAVMMLRLAELGPEAIVERTTMVGFEAIRDAAERGGVIGVTGHLGNWEIAGASVAAHGVPIDAVGKGMANPLFGTDLVRTRERLGMTVVDMLDAPRVVLRNLRRGGRLQGLLADQNAHRGGIFVPFFGKAAATVRGPALFALRTGAPIFLIVAVRDPGARARYTVTCTPIPYEVTGDNEADTYSITLAYNEALEAAIRNRPEQYFWLHKRWKKRPEPRNMPFPDPV